jgi:hypothetical protein
VLHYLRKAQRGLTGSTLGYQAGFAVSIPGRPLCCGLAWISTASSTLDPQPGDQGVGSGRPGPVVGVEPSSTAVLHAEAVELLGDDPMSLVELKKRSLTDRDGPRWSLRQTGAGMPEVRRAAPGIAAATACFRSSTPPYDRSGST